MLSLEVLNREVSSKLDIALMTLGRMQRAVAPSEKRITKPPGMPQLPLGTETALRFFEKFLKTNDNNLAAVVSIESVIIFHSLLLSIRY